ncbi:hypothetical protein KKD61_04445 [Patescibacteria group bacterium]|nr:hypothetical protein [Patescibacteria group bacterium]
MSKSKGEGLSYQQPDLPSTDPIKTEALETVGQHPHPDEGEGRRKRWPTATNQLYGAERALKLLRQRSG